MNPGSMTGVGPKGWRLPVWVGLARFDGRVGCRFGPLPYATGRPCRPPGEEGPVTMYDDDARGARPRLLQAALNGDREHPATPRTPEEIAAEARAAVDAGAASLHLHPYDGDGARRSRLGRAPPRCGRCAPRAPGSRSR